MRNINAEIEIRNLLILSDFSYEFKKLHFPLKYKLLFAMTCIYNYQGQILCFTEVHLGKTFSCEQFYITCSIKLTQKSGHYITRKKYFYIIHVSISIYVRIAYRKVLQTPDSIVIASC